VGAVLFVVGPTASGKTALAITLALALNGEIINCDSRQFYRGMDIGTAKPSVAELAAVPHHLIDIADPSEVCGLAWFLDRTHLAIGEIRARARLPIIAGGTGQFARAMLEAWEVPRVPPDAVLRAALNRRAETEGVDALVAELERLDPERAAQIDRRNVRRVTRALEVALLRPHVTEPEPPRALIDHRLVLGIEIERAELYARIDRRVEAIFAAGFVAEVQALNAAGWDCRLAAFSAIGYREVCGYLRGELTLDEAREKTRTSTHRLARTQAAWFRRSDPRITWLPFGPELAERALEVTRAFLNASAAQE